MAFPARLAWPARSYPWPPHTARQAAATSSYGQHFMSGKKMLFADSVTACDWLRDGFWLDKIWLQDMIRNKFSCLMLFSSCFLQSQASQSFAEAHLLNQNSKLI
jgi:hypothetical protein